MPSLEQELTNCSNMLFNSTFLKNFGAIIRQDLGPIHLHVLKYFNTNFNVEIRVEIFQQKFQRWNLCWNSTWWIENVTQICDEAVQ